MSIPGAANPLLLATAAAGGYQISRSLRFNSSDSAFCSRTFGANPSTRTKCHWHWCVKRGSLGSDQRMFSGYSGTSGDSTWLIFRSDNAFQFNVGGSQGSLISNAVFRDPSAWYIFDLAFDSTQAVASDRAKFWVNGVLQTWASGSVTQNAQHEFALANSNNRVGANWDSSLFFDGLLADVFFIDGQALDPSSFTEVSATTGQLIPKQYTGSFGTNGFWLKFSDNSAATATTLGKDYSGNNNNWSPSNLSVQVGLNYSSNVTTVATSFYNGTPATMFDGSTSTYYGVTSNNGSNSSISIDLTGKGVSVSTGIRVYGTYRNGMVWQINGSTVSSSGVSHPNTGWQTLSGWSSGSITSISVSVPSGSANEIYAIEVNGAILTNSSGAGNDSLVDTPTSAGTDTGLGGQVAGNYCTLNPLNPTTVTLSNGNLDCVTNNAATHVRGTIGISSGKYYWECSASNLAGDLLVGICTPSAAFNTDLIGSNAWTYFSSNGNKYTSSGSSYGASWTTGDVIGVAFDADNGTLTFYKNGTSQGQAFSSLTSGPYFPAVSDGSSGASSTFSINFGQRPFAYTAPSGFKALCDTNLTAPVVAKPSEVMDVKLWTGNGSSQTISGLGFSPDLVWIKARSQSIDWHALFNTVVGATTRLFSNSTSAEATNTQTLTAFNSDGFSVGNTNEVNGSSTTYVGWCWDAGSSTVTNTQGSITSQVRANASAGFSIVTYTGNATNGATVGHGLGIAPAFFVIKKRDATSNWTTYHRSLGAGGSVFLNLTDAYSSDPTRFNNTAPSSTVVTLGAPFEGNTSGATYVMYCFAPVAGYNSISSFVGNNSTDGTFVYTGHRVRWLLLKNATSAGTSWVVFDSARSSYNVVGQALLAHSSSSELSGTFIDFLSNGFKLRVSSDPSLNNNGDTYIYMAIAESPFQYARAR